MPSLIALLVAGVVTMTGMSATTATRTLESTASGVLGPVEVSPPGAEPGDPATGPDTPPTSQEPPTAPSTTPTTVPPTTSRPTTSRPTTVPPTTQPQPQPEVEPESSLPPTTEVDDADDPAPAERVSISPRVSDTVIPVGSIVLAALVLFAVAVVSYLLQRRRPGTPPPSEPPPDSGPDERTSGPVAAGPHVASADPPDRPRAPDTNTLNFLVALGESLIDAGDAVSHVQSTLQTVACVNGVEQLGVLVLPTALVVSVPGGDNVATQVSSAGQAPLRLDQTDDVLRLVDEASSGAIDPTDGHRRLRSIRSSPPPFRTRVALLGSVLSTAGLVTILRGGWREIAVAVVLGFVVGAFRLSTRRLASSYQPFIPLVAATAVSISVFTCARVVDDLLTFPLLVAPLATLLPGAVLTMAVLELATGQIISGASRLASGVMQLVLLAIGIVAGRQLVGVPSTDLQTGFDGPLAFILPWAGVAVFGVGVVWFHGARTSARRWILLVLYVAYSGQVIGGLFFGSSLSAFFGALVMTPVAIFASRQPSGPTQLVTFLPGFWILVPGALGLEGVTRLLDGSAVAGSGALVTTITSMIGISLGILLGSTLARHKTLPHRPDVTAPSDG